MNAKREREAHTAVAAYLREAHPDAQWDAIDDLGRALAHETRYGPMPYNYWNDKAGGDALCVQWFSWAEGCKHLSAIIEALPVEVWYDFDSGCVTETDPYQWPGNWTEGGEGDGDVDEELPEYVGPDDTRTVPTIEALFDRELWRYLT